MSDIAPDGPVWTGPLAHRISDQTGSPVISIDEIWDLGVIDFRVRPSDRAAQDTASAILGFALPETHRASRSKGKITCLWFSVDQWLITGPRALITELFASLSEALADHAAAVTDVSDLRAIFRLSGPKLRNVLAKCAPVDFFADDIQPGYVRRISFGELAAALHFSSEDLNQADLYVFRSYADYAIDWLEEAARDSADISLFEPTKPPLV